VTAPFNKIRLAFHCVPSFVASALPNMLRLRATTVPIPMAVICPGCDRLETIRKDSQQKRSLFLSSEMGVAV
jgi:hypothetical protein